MSAPSSQMLPDDGLSTPVIRLTSVVLPAPFGPISARARAALEREVDVARDMQRAEAAIETLDFQRRAS